jgi:hypothetical protein
MGKTLNLLMLQKLKRHEVDRFGNILNQPFNNILLFSQLKISERKSQERLYERISRQMA